MAVGQVEGKKLLKKQTKIEALPPKPVGHEK
jgi:hypothetical protein